MKINDEVVVTLYGQGPYNGVLKGFQETSVSQFAIVDVYDVGLCKVHLSNVQPA